MPPPEDLILPDDAGTAAGGNPSPKAPESSAPVKDRLLGLARKAQADFSKGKAGTPGAPPSDGTKPDAGKPAPTKDDSFAALRTKLETTTAEYDAKLKATAAEVEAAKTKAREAEARLAKYNIQETLLFNEKFVQPEQEAQRAIAEALGKVAISPEDWSAAVQAGPAKVTEILTQLQEKGKVAEADQLMVATHAVQSLRRNAGAFIAEHQKDLAKVQAEEAALQTRRKEEMSAFRTNELNKVLDEARAKEPWGVFLTPKDGNQKWNEQVDRLAGNARAIIDSNDFHLQAKAAHAAVLVPGLIEQLKQYRAEIADLKSKLGGVGSAARASAGIGGSGGAGGSPAPRPAGNWKDMSAAAGKGALDRLRGARK